MRTTPPPVHYNNRSNKSNHVCKRRSWTMRDAMKGKQSLISTRSQNITTKHIFRNMYLFSSTVQKQNDNTEHRNYLKNTNTWGQKVQSKSPNTITNNKNSQPLGVVGWTGFEVVHWGKLSELFHIDNFTPVFSSANICET